MLRFTYSIFKVRLQCISYSLSEVRVVDNSSASQDDLLLTASFHFTPFYAQRRIQFDHSQNPCESTVLLESHYIAKLYTKCFTNFYSEVISHKFLFNNCPEEIRDQSYAKMFDIRLFALHVICNSSKGKIQNAIQTSVVLPR